MRFLVLFLVIATISLIECMPQADPECKKDCSGVELKAVCGGDTLAEEFQTKDFESECHLEMHNCENKQSKYKKLFYGKCFVEKYDDGSSPTTS